MRDRRSGPEAGDDPQGSLPLAAPAPVPVAPTPRPGDKERPLSVEALVRGMGMVLEQRVGLVWIEGEVSNLRVHGSGHVYFVLKDAGAQLPAVMWKSTAQRLRFRLEEGKTFLVRGRPSVYQEQGKLQLYVEAIEPAGLGAAALALDQLKHKLAAEGLFAAGRKRALPRLPRRIGVVTSPTGAAVRDVIRVIERRFPTAILISPARVQGDGAGAEIAQALQRLWRWPGVDVIIVGRGGGSAEDLSAFNEEIVVRAIAASPVPVISAVGHEVDVTLADLVADVRAATPTAAGELAVPERAELADRLVKAERALARAAEVVLERRRRELERLEARLVDPRRRLARDRQRLDELVVRAEKAMRAGLQRRGRELGELELRRSASHPRARLAERRVELKELAARAAAAAQAALEARRRKLEQRAGRLDAMSPLKVLERGYALARTAEGHVVTDAAQVAPGDPLQVRVARGEIDVRVERVKKEPEGDDEQ